MTVDKMIEVLNAFNTGKKIQYSVKNGDSPVWLDTAYPAWDFNVYEYRAKPEPKEFLVVVDKYGQVVGGCNNNFKPGQVVCYRHGSKISDCTVVKVREVL